MTPTLISVPWLRRVVGLLGVLLPLALVVIAGERESISAYYHSPARDVFVGWLVAIAVLLREGIVPFHSWYPALYSGAPMSMALAATVPQVGAYTAVRLLIGHADHGDGVAQELVVQETRARPRDPVVVRTPREAEGADRDGDADTGAGDGAPHRPVRLGG